MHIIVRNDPKSTTEPCWVQPVIQYDFIVYEVSQDTINVCFHRYARLFLLRIFVFFTVLLTLTFTLLLQEVDQ
jgi:hypothetical protein